MGRSGDGSGVSDPPFAQLGGSSGGGFLDGVSAFGQGAFNAIAPTEFKEAVAGVGDARAFQKRRDKDKIVGAGIGHKSFIQNLKNKVNLKLGINTGGEE